MSGFLWATITGLSPLRLQLDGDAAPLPLTPDSLVDPRQLTVSDRVRVQVANKRVVIYGRSSGLVPVIKSSIILNGGLRTNQDGYVSGTNIPIGTYAFDGIKASGVINLHTNPSIETATTGFSASTGTPTLTSDTGQAKTGTHSLKAVSTASSTDVAVGYTLAGLVIGKLYNVSRWVYSVDARTQCYLDTNSAATPISGATSTGTATSVTAGAWTRVSAVIQATATTAAVIFRNAGGPSATGKIVYQDGFQVTEGATLYPTFDGSTTDCSWSGTANASTSYNVPNVVPTLTGTFDPNFGSFFTINANGRVCQILERSLVPAGSYIEVNGGTAQTRVYNNTTAPGSRPAWTTGPVTFAADGTDDVVVEYFGGAGGATIGQLRMFAGSTDYGFTLQRLETEVRECQRHYFCVESPPSDYAPLGVGVGFGATAITRVNVRWPVRMRSIPTIATSSLIAWNGSGNYTTTNTTVGPGITVDGMVSDFAVASGGVTGQAFSVQVPSGGSTHYFRADARIR